MKKFETLVSELDEDTLHELHAQVAAEMEQRRLKTAIHMKDIHPRMSAEEKTQAALDIARVLRERGLMRDLQQYWQEIRAIENGLPQFVWVIAEDCLMEVARAVAARLLHAKSHRLATDEEVKSSQGAGGGAKKQAEEKKRRRKGSKWWRFSRLLSLKFVELKKGTDHSVHGQFGQGEE